MNTVRLTALIVCSALLLAPHATPQEKLAQTGMKFLSVGTDARAMALGEAFTAVEGTSTSLFFNTASMARLKGFTSLGLGYTSWIADMKHLYASVAFAPASGDYGVFGVFVQSVDYGTFEGTIRWDNDKGYLDEGDMPGLNFNPSGLAIGIGYARALSDKFSIGGNVKYITQDLGDVINEVDAPKVSNKANVIAFDFGILYRTGFKSLNFGMTVRNFSREARFQNEGFQLPLTFKIGFSMDLLDLTDLDKEMHKFLVVADWAHPRDFQEQIMVGGEYTFMNIIALRAGYVGPADEHSMSYGVGLKPEVANLGFALDYAYTPFGVFDAVHRFTFQFSL